MITRCRVARTLVAILVLVPVIYADDSTSPSDSAAVTLSTNAIPFELEEAEIVVPALINGHKVHLLLDTGSELVFISPKVAALVGIHSESRAQVKGNGAEQRSAQVARAASLAVGSITAHEVPLGIMPFPSDFHWDGILGDSFLDHFAFHVDYDRRLVTFHLPSEKNLDGTPSTQLPFKILSTTGKQNGVAVTIEAEIDGTKANFAIDTGSGQELVLYPWFTEQHKLRDSYPNRVKVITGAGLGGLIHGEIVRLHSLKLGELNLTNLVAEFGSEGSYAELDRSHRVAGVIGGGALLRFNYTFDFPNRQLGLEPSREFSADIPPPASVNSGMVCWPTGTQWEIVDVIPQSAAAEAGIQIGERLLRINNKPIETYKFCAIRDVFRSKPGTIVHLTVQTNGKEPREVTLILRNLL